VACLHRSRRPNPHTGAGDALPYRAACIRPPVRAQGIWHRTPTALHEPRSTQTPVVCGPCCTPQPYHSTTYLRSALSSRHHRRAAVCASLLCRTTTRSAILRIDPAMGRQPRKVCAYLTHRESQGTFELIRPRDHPASDTMGAAITGAQALCAESPQRRHYEGKPRRARRRPATTDKLMFHVERTARGPHPPKRASDSRMRAMRGSTWNNGLPRTRPDWNVTGGPPLHTPTFHVEPSRGQPVRPACDSDTVRRRTSTSMGDQPPGYRPNRQDSDVPCGTSPQATHPDWQDAEVPRGTSPQVTHPDRRAPELVPGARLGVARGASRRATQPIALPLRCSPGRGHRRSPWNRREATRPGRQTSRLRPRRGCRRSTWNRPAGNPARPEDESVAAPATDVDVPRGTGRQSTLPDRQTSRLRPRPRTSTFHVEPAGRQPCPTGRRVGGGPGHGRRRFTWNRPRASGRSAERNGCGGGGTWHLATRPSSTMPRSLG
jgi:hypothetical protein